MDGKIISAVIGVLIIFSIIFVYINHNFIEDKEPCNLKMEGVGTCKINYFGYEYDSTTNECIEAEISGCDAQIPFHDKLICEEHCVQ